MNIEHKNSLATKQKSLTINLNKSIYGSFAEIGAGQDVAANFFKAGGASGTIAKTMSAYDMIYSDSIYGVQTDKRYVSEARLLSMLDHEFKLIIERLDHQKGDETTFFAFADTISALNYQKSNDAHGWMGLRFQLTPKGPSNEVILHVKLLDNDNNMQQQAVGILGVNLIYACYNFTNPLVFMQSLMDDLSRHRIQIDMIRFEGPAFKNVDNRLMSLHLVKFGFSDVAVFGPDGNNLPPSDALYKKHIVMVRGRFRPVVNVHVDMWNNGVKQFLERADVDPKNVLVITELTLQGLKDRDATDPAADIDKKDFLDRVDILCALGQTVMISNYHEYYKLVAYLSKITTLKMGIVLGYPNLEYIFGEEHYKNLPGGILESFATLFSGNVQLFIYPTLRDGNIQNCLHFNPPSNLIDLYRYLIANNKIEDILHYNERNLEFQTDDVLSMIKRDDPGWEDLVPAEVAKMIKDRCLFGYCDSESPEVNEQAVPGESDI